MLISIHSILGWASFCMNYCINLAWHGGNQPVALLRCKGSPGCFDSGLQVICIVGSGVSHLPLDNASFWYLWQCGQVPSPAGKLNQHLHKACQQKEAWSALKFPGRWLRWLHFRKHSRPIPADDMAVHHWLWKLHTGLQATWICASPLFLQNLGPWFPNEMLNLL